MTLARWQPYGQCSPRPQFNNFGRRVNPFFNFFDNESGLERVWQPKINVLDLEERYEISAELPGMSRDAVSIELNQNILKISGEKKVEHEDKELNFFRRERSYGTFSRSFKLGPEVESEKIDAKFDNGVLTISIPKGEKRLAKKIEIQDN